MTAARLDDQPGRAESCARIADADDQGRHRRSRSAATAKLDAGDVESALGDRDKDAKGTRSLPVRIDARYVEMGKDRRGGGNYVLRYRWEGGGLFGGRSLRLTGFGRG